MKLMLSIFVFSLINLNSLKAQDELYTCEITCTYTRYEHTATRDYWTPERIVGKYNIIKENSSVEIAFNEAARECMISRAEKGLKFYISKVLDENSQVPNRNEVATVENSCAPSVEFQVQ